MKRCCNCGKEIGDHISFCPYCGEKQDENGNNVKVRYCTRCGRKWGEEEEYCPICGSEKEKIYDTKVSKNDEKKVSTDKKTEKSQQKEGHESDSDSKLLKILGTILGIVYAYNIFTYMPYLKSYTAFSFIWGLGMVLTYAWCSVICFVIAYKSRKEYGMTLFYALCIGEILKGVLSIIEVYQITYYWERSSATYLPIVGAVLVSLGAYYLMKRKGLIVKNEEWKVMDYIRDIPVVLQGIFSKIETDKIRERVSKGVLNSDENDPRYENSTLNIEAKKIWRIVNHNVFLIFGGLYTINLLYRVFASFSFFNIANNLFSILICIAIWMIYFSGRKGTLDAAGFSIVNGIMWIKVFVHVVIGFILLCVAGYIDIRLFLIALILVTMDVAYWWSLGSILSSITKNAKNEVRTLKAGIYPMLVLGVNVVLKTASFTWASFLQSTANSVNGSLNEYGNMTSSIVGSLFGDLGLGYDTGYGWTSSIAQSIISPITEWVQSNLGFSQNPFIMMIAIAIPVLEIILLSKVRASR